MKNEVCECCEQLQSQDECLRSQDQRLAEHDATLAMLLKLINKTTGDVVGTSKGGGGTFLIISLFMVVMFLQRLQVYIIEPYRDTTMIMSYGSMIVS